MAYKYDPTFARSLATDANSSTVTAAVQSSSAPFMGPVDIVETPTEFIWLLDCAGLSSKDVHVRVTHNLLQLSGQRTSTKLPAESKYLRKERPAVETFCRVFKLPLGADFTNVKANCEHGTLSVTVAKDAESLREAQHKADWEALSEGDGSLNAEFEKVPISVFPTPALGKIVMVRSDMPLIEAVRTLSEHHILSAPVIDVNAPADAGWTDKYLGIFDMSGAVYHMLNILKPETSTDFVADASKVEALHKTLVKDAVTFSGYGPFIPVEFDRGNLLQVMLLCGQHNLRRVPVVKSPGGDVVNIITQSALVQTLGANLDKFKAVAKKTLTELNLGRRGTVISVTEDEPLRVAFERMRDNEISAVPVLDNQGRVCGNVSARDARLVVSSQKIYNLLNMPISTYLAVVTNNADNSAVVCKASDTLETVIKTLVQSRIHRIYVVDDERRPLRVVSLSNVLRKFVKEPAGFFGHFFS